mgnify:CR=1 FL=1
MIFLILWKDPKKSEFQTLCYADTQDDADKIIKKRIEFTKKQLDPSTQEIFISSSDEETSVFVSEPSFIFGSPLKCVCSYKVEKVNRFSGEEEDEGTL